jgi:AhpD family alkylhydroperoxidase
MYDRGFIQLTNETATPTQRKVLDDSRAHFGGVPPAVARLAISPEFMAAFQTGIAAFDRTSLTPVEREVVILVLARDIGCSICTTMHSAIIGKLGERAIAVALGDRIALVDPKLAALARFTESLLATRGDVDPASWEAFLTAGYTRAQALEILIGFGTYTMSTYANRLAGSH